MRTKDVSEMTDEDLEAVDMESNLDGSEYSDGGYHGAYGWRLFQCGL